MEGANGGRRKEGLVRGGRRRGVDSWREGDGGLLCFGLFGEMESELDDQITSGKQAR